MSVGGIGPGIPDVFRGDPARRPDEGNGAGSARSTEAAARQPVVPRVPETASEAEAAPDGVDAELWSLLTTDERAHFARFAAMGGVTYGPRAEGPTRPPVRGHRLDLRI